MKLWFEEKNAPEPGALLCPLKDIEVDSVKEFEFGDVTKSKFRMFIYRSHDGIVGFINKCPHFNVPLNIESNALFCADGEHFQCCHHYAKFDKTSGLCVDGPCEGRSLTQIPIRVVDDNIVISADES